MNTYRSDPIKDLGKLIGRLSSGLFLCLLALLGSGLLAWPDPIKAQVTCYGSDCAATGLDFDQIEESLRQTYLRKLSEDFAAATAVSNTVLPYNGSVNLHILTIGAQAAVGLSPSSSNSLAEMTDSEIRNARSGGWGLNGIIFIGFNLGNTIDQLGIIDGLLLLPKFLSLDRFEFFYGLANNSFEFEDEARVDEWQLSFNSVYYEMRYQILGSLSPLGSLLSWEGLSVRLGYIDTKRSITASDQDRTATPYLELGEFDWIGDTDIRVRQTVSTIPIEFNTGLRLLHFFTATAGAGMAFHNGNSTIDFQRQGITGLRLPQISSNARVVADLQGEEKIDEFTPYLKAGFEVHLIPYTSIGGEATMSDGGLHAFSAGVRANI